MIGRVFNGRYRITERIGIGGMAEVYKAQDQTLGRIVAVKVMLPQYAADPEFAARFKQEAASAANLQSPYIVNVYDWGHDDGTYFIVMEYVRGTDLKSAILQRGAINQRKVAEIGSQVCQALSVAHNQDIIHRDVKPQNIMVQPDGNVKVMDFGIARAKNSVKSQTSSVLGTAHYISPEQAQGKELTGASDMYSLGCVLYEAATGQLPFDGPDAVSVAMKQVQEEPLPPSQVKPDISPDLEAIILKAMDKNPYNRFQTARDMKQALDDFLMGRPVNIAGAAGGFASASTSVMGSVPGMASEAGGTAVMQPIGSDTGMKTNSYRGGNDIDMGKAKSKKRGPLIAVAAIAAIAVIAALAFAITGGLGGGDKVPNVIGQTQEAAVQTIEKAGYTVGTVTEDYDAETVAGRVCKQDPEADSGLEKGGKINIIISKGVKKGSIPNLSGMTSEQAEKALKDAGLKAQYAGNEASDADKDTVSRQDPAAGKEVDEGTTVKYWISTGPEDTSVPNVVGSDQASAKAQLESAGFTVQVETGDYSDKYGEGIVMSQSPNGGKLEKGGTVTITISQGQDPEKNKVAVPSVTGMGQSEAINTLLSYNLAYALDTASAGSGTPGTVAKQSITAGKKVDSGTVITIYVVPESSSSTGDNTNNSGNTPGTGSTTN
ncbi:Stk1 family PASTA domain-containing Ser/Thr kinase [Slackia isoflavoniconvertens]|uniref:Stk1 family PASTA domain-containing Ser/Thr kinase n=1 Tax=Slackia isoflavoniconvertens TaxID=572010 RepID=UPI003A97AA86